MRRILFLLLIVSSFCNAQEDSHTYFRKKINKVENDFEKILKDNKYVIYSTTHTMHLLLNKQDTFYHLVFTGEYDDDFKIKNLEIITDKEIKKVFHKTSYKKGLIDGNSDFYNKNSIEEMSGLPTYFSFNTNFQTRYCEYFLSVIIKPVPMDFDAFRYLSFLILDLEPVL